MKPDLLIRWLCGLWLVLGAAEASPAGPPTSGTVQPGDRVAIQLASGRRMAATLDPRSNDQALWVRWDLQSGFVLRPLQWGRVVEVEYRGRRIPAGQLWAAIRDWPPRVAGVRSGGEAGRAAPGAPGASADGPRSDGDRPASEAPLAGPVCSVGTDVRVSNWDGDVETDGLVVDLQPLDSHGWPVPVRGVLQVQLFAERTGVVQRGRPVVRRARWVQAVQLGDYSGGRATFRFPFRAFHPEFQEGWAPYGAVHVRLAVPGQGVFEATDGLVRLRPYSALRDRYQQRTGRRFLPFEATGRSARGE